MQHYWDDRPLDDTYARETIVALFKLWKNVIVLSTRNKDAMEYLYICNGPNSEKDVHVVTREEYEKEFMK
jgi:spore cortex formation protein SpoVR/YcgB (stage V sporulation)